MSAADKIRCPHCRCDFDAKTGRIISKAAREHPTAQEQNTILSAYATLTGHQFNPIPPEIAYQARQFARFFTCADLELVIAYLRSMLTQDKGFTLESWSWRKLMSDAPNFALFQDRLRAAKEAKTRRTLKFTPTYEANTPIPKPAKPTLPPGHHPAPKPADDATRQAAIEALENAKRQLRNQS